MQVNEDHQA
jgi:hypothetical protein